MQIKPMKPPGICHKNHIFKLCKKYKNIKKKYILFGIDKFMLLVIREKNYEYRLVIKNCYIIHVIYESCDEIPILCNV